MTTLGRYLRSLDDYWFGKRSPTALGVFRIVLATLGLIDLLMIAPDWGAWYSERGYVPVALNRMYQGAQPYLWINGPRVPRINVISWTTDPVINRMFFGLLIVLAILTAIGLWTRVSSILWAIGIVSLHHRNILILHGGDTVIRIMSIYLAWSPCGAACSVDRLIGLWNGKIDRSPVRVSLWVQRVITYNVALCYITTVWVKRFGVHWMDGTATWYTARLPEFYRFPVPAFLDDMPMVKVSTWGTLLIELSLGTLVFYRPLRKYVLLGGILLHGYIDYSMNIPLFSYLMVSMYICFFDGEEISAWAGRVGTRLRRWHITVSTPRGSRLRPNAGAFLQAVDPFGLVTYVSGEQDRWTARTAAGSSVDGYWGAFSRSLGAWPGLIVFPLWRRLLDGSLEPDRPAPEITSQSASLPV